MVSRDEVGRGRRVVLAEASGEEAGEGILLACGELHSTWFQRRAGLVTLVATTAGGSQRVVVVDVPEDVAVALAGHALPGLVDQFRP